MVTITQRETLASVILIDGNYRETLASVILIDGDYNTERNTGQCEGY